MYIDVEAVFINWQAFQKRNWQINFEVEKHFSVCVLCNFQDSDGDTALHCAVHSRKFQSVRILLEAGADPSLVNFQLLTPLHLAAKVGFLP